MNTLKLAIQKKGRLREKTEQLIKDCGIHVNWYTNYLKSKAENFPLEIYFLRDDDIPEYVAEKIADVGIVGENLCTEEGKDIQIIEKLGFAKCRLSIAVRESSDIQEIDQLNDITIATTYPNTLKSFLDQKNISAKIQKIHGSTEIAPNIGLSTAICDMVSTGNTLAANRLRELVEIGRSEAVLVANPDLSTEQNLTLQRLSRRLCAVRNAKKSKYIVFNINNAALDKACEVLPSLKSPTVVPLADPNWSSVHSVIEENIFWDMVDALKELGAEGILVTPIEKIIE